MDFVQIGNAGNAADSTGFGSVAYSYSMEKYEVSRGQIDKAIAGGLQGINMNPNFGGNGANRPATGVNYYEAATYVNWLNTDQGYHVAYNFVDGAFTLWSEEDLGYNANNQFRNSLAKYVIASSDEWYKAAYGNLNGTTWNKYANGSDTAPVAVVSGIAANTAVHRGMDGNLITPSEISPSGPADITTAGGLSAYGTMGQGGNVFEWTEAAVDGTAEGNRVLRGGSWNDDSIILVASYSGESAAPVDEAHVYGFRVVSVPEPSSLSLLAIGLGGLALVRRRKQS
jgi:formylglycine-generating enzyme required for sulfatase activity